MKPISKSLLFVLGMFIVGSPILAQDIFLCPAHCALAYDENAAYQGPRIPSDGRKILSQTR